MTTQQRRRGEHFAAAEARDDLERGPDDEAADDDDEQDGGDTFRGKQEAARPADLVGPEQRQQRDQRNDGEILEQQDRERAPSARTAQFSALAEPGEDDRRGGHRQAEPDDDRGLPGLTERDGDRGNRDSREQDLRAAQTEHRLAQRPQPRRLELESDQEQQQHHAQLGDVQRGFGVADEAEAPRADDRARGEIAEHRAQLQPPEQRDDDHRRTQKDGGLL